MYFRFKSSNLFQTLLIIVSITKLNCRHITVKFFKTIKYNYMTDVNNANMSVI